MMKKFGIGLLFSFYIFSCSTPFPPPEEILIESISVFDFSSGRFYEELEIFYKWKGFPSLEEVTLKNFLYPEIVVFLDPSLEIENGYYKAFHSHIRFSYFMTYLPRGLYTLSFRTKEGRSFIYDFYLEGLFLKTEIIDTDIEEILREGFQLIKENEKLYLRGENKGKTLIIKEFPLDLLGPPGLEPGTNGL